MQFLKFSVILIIIVTLIALLSSCATPLRVNVTASHWLNPDDVNHALPVQLIIYQLNDDQTFKQATFQELWQDDKTILNNTLLSRREINIVPGSHNKIILQRENGLNYVGVIAIFRHPVAGHWRALQKIGKGVPLTKKNVNFYLHGNSIRSQ